MRGGVLLVQFFHTIQPALWRLLPLRIEASDASAFIRLPYVASMNELKRMEAFYDCIGATNGTLQMPVTLFIKDGKFIAKRVSRAVGYSELESALRGTP